MSPKSIGPGSVGAGSIGAGSVETAPSRRRLGVRGLLAAAALVVAVGLGAWRVAVERDELLAALGTLGVGAAVLAFLTGLVGVVATGQSWRAWLRGVGVELPLLSSHCLFYVTQAGKYVPGAVWPLVAQAAAARRFGVSRASMPVATVFFMAGHVLTGVLVGGVVAVVLGLAPVPSALMAAAALAAAVVLLCTPVLARACAGWLGSRLGKGWRPPALRDVLLASAWMLVAWAAYGISTAVLVSRLSAGGQLWLLGAGAFALAWTAGFAVLVSPAGAGARDLVLVALLGPALPGAEALAVALVSRVVLTLADLALAAVSGVLLHLSGAGRRGTSDRRESVNHSPQVRLEAREPGEGGNTSSRPRAMRLRSGSDKE